MTIYNWNITWRTTLADKMKTAVMRQREPMILSLSNMAEFWELAAVAEAACGVTLCIMLIVKAPNMHTTVPIIFTLLYIQLSFTFSNLQYISMYIHSIIQSSTNITHFFHIHCTKYLRDRGNIQFMITYKFVF